VLLTCLEYFLRAHDLRPADIARLADYARQHLLAIRKGEYEPSRRFIVDTTCAISAQVHREVSPSELFERAEALLQTTTRRLRHVHSGELEVLAVMLAGVAVSAAHAVAALGRLAVASDRRAVIAGVRTAMRDSEIEGASDLAAEA